MVLNLGTAPVVAAYLGTTPVTRGYLGSIEVASWFQPDQLAGLLTWYDASDNTTLTVLAASKISQITDKSGNNLTLTQGTDANRPTIAATFLPPNGRQAMRLGGSQYLLNEAVSFAAGDVTSFCAFRLGGTATSGARLFAWGRAGIADAASGGTMLHYRSAATQTAAVYGGTGIAAAALVYDQWCVHSATRLAAEVRSAVDGGTDVVVTASVSTPLGPLTRVALGSALVAGGGGNASTWLGGFGEQFSYSRLLSAAERAACEGYLAWKWGTQALLPAGHPWAARPPPRGS